MSKRGDLGYSPAWRTGTTIYLPPLFRSMMKRDFQGKQHFPREGGMIVAANHLSYADWAAVAFFTHQAGRYPAFLIKSGVFDIKVIGPYLRILGQLPVQRGQTDAALVLKDAERGLAEGECLIFYPEGTASRDPDLWPMVAKTGVARLALTTGVPVIPLAHWGAQDILRYGSKRPHLVPRTTVHMLAGPPVDLSDYAGKPLSKETLRGATDAIMADITGLLAELRGATPPAVPYDPAAARRAARQDSPPANPSSHTERTADEPGKATPP
jgi:1-acyl-sn-glycerol-3-phosphate acyltransferase